jgi:hypothetical protein
MAQRRARGPQRRIAETLLPLGAALREVGRVSEASSRLREGLALADSLADHLLIVRFLEALACAEPETQSGASRSARWLGATAGQRRLLRTPVPPVERVWHDAAIAWTQTRLGEAAWLTAWASGQTGPFNQIVAGPRQCKLAKHMNPSSGSGRAVGPL